MFVGSTCLVVVMVLILVTMFGICCAHATSSEVKPLVISLLTYFSMASITLRGDAPPDAITHTTQVRQ